MRQLQPRVFSTGFLTKHTLNLVCQLSPFPRHVYFKYSFSNPCLVSARRHSNAREKTVEGTPTSINFDLDSKYFQQFLFLLFNIISSPKYIVYRSVHLSVTIVRDRFKKIELQEGMFLVPTGWGMRWDVCSMKSATSL